MNLHSLRQRIMQQSNRVTMNNSGDGYTAYLNDLINEAYRRVWLDRPAEYNVVETELRLWPDYTASDLAATITFTQYSDVVTLSADPFHSSDPYVVDKTLGAFIVYNNVYYRIENILSATQWKIDKVYEGTTTVASTYKIVHRFVKLPTDCEELLDLEFLDFPITDQASMVRKPLPLPRKNVHISHLDADSTSTHPSYFVLGNTTQPSELPLVLAATDNVGSGDISIANTTFQFAFTVVDYNGSESSVAGVTSHTAGASVDSIDVSFVQTVSTSDESARFRAHIYMGVENDGVHKWYRITDEALRQHPNFSSLTITGSMVRSVLRGDREHALYTGPVQVRDMILYPRPIATMKTEAAAGVNGISHFNFSVANIRYITTPKPLVWDLDSPALPAAFHHVIVHAALIELYSRNGDAVLARLEENKYEKELKRMYGRYATDAFVPTAMGSARMSTVSRSRFGPQPGVVSYIKFPS